MTFSNLLIRVRQLDGQGFRYLAIKSALRALLGLGTYSGFTRDVVVEYQGKKFIITKDGGLNIISCEYYEPVCFAFMRSIQGGVFVDVGANVGSYIVHFAGNFDKVLAVEPNPIAAKLLNANIRLNDLRNVTVIEKAVGSGSGKVPLYSAKNLVNWSLSHESESSVLVNMASLDELLSDLDHVNVVLVDAEGYELEVVRGCSNSFSKIDNLLIEVRGVYEPAITKIMERNGFTSQVLEDRGTEKNLLFCHADAEKAC